MKKNNYLKELRKTFWKGIIWGLWFLSIIWFAWISYAAFTWFTWLDATPSESLTAEKWNNLVDAVQDEYSTSETLTNKVWLWQPVYRKVYNLPTFNTWLNTLAHWLTNFTVVNYYYSAINTSSYTTWPAWSNWAFMALISSTHIRYYLDDNSRTSWFIVLEYTKN